MAMSRSRIRLPAHGTVPGALTDVEWQDWMAATRLAVREAKRRIGPSLPLHMVGFSNGGALALKYALDAIEDPTLARPDRLVLISPMIGITEFARFAGLAGLPAIFPAFAKAAWLSVLPEFNPFKYNSFPVNGARQSFLLTNALQQQITRLARERRLDRLAPVLTFQSVIDFTVSTRAIVDCALCAASREWQRTRAVRPEPQHQIRPAFADRFGHRRGAVSCPTSRRLFRTTVIATANAESGEVVERVTEAGASRNNHAAWGSFIRPVSTRFRMSLCPFPSAIRFMECSRIPPKTSASTSAPSRRAASGAR